MDKCEEADEELEWLRSLTGRHTVKPEDLKGVGSYPFPLNPNHNVRPKYPELAAKDDIL